MKTRVLTIGFAAVVLVLAAGAGGLYAYDSSRSDMIAKGITAGGVDVGGLSAARARDVLERSLGPRVGQGVALERGGQGGSLAGRGVGRGRRRAEPRARVADPAPAARPDVHARRVDPDTDAAPARQ